MTSLFSNTMSPVKDTSSLPRRQSSLNKPPLRALYDLLIAPMEGGLMHSSGPVGRHRQLILVLEGELHLIPFALLKGSSSNEYLYERFSLIAIPSIQSLSSTAKSHSKKNAPTYSSPTSMAAVIGNPKLPSSIMDRWLWGPMPSAEEEAYMVSELLGCQPLVGPAATKERVMSALSQAECVHFATHMSWKLAALVLTPNSDGSSGGGGGKGSYGNSYSIPESLRMQDDASDVESITDSPPLQEFLLTAADILDLRLPVKLVVLGSYQESNSKVTADGVIGLTRAFLAAGAQCVLVFLWPVPVAASKMFVHAFYSALLNGMKASAALADAMKTVQSSKQFSHPSNWAGFMLIGSDVKLNSPSSLIGQALSEILQHPERARDSLRVLLHLRYMYTTRYSITRGTLQSFLKISFIGLTRAFLAAGAQCVLVFLWPVPVAASKMFVHAFYSALLNGMKASAALADAMKTVQSNKQFSHPSNWAGFMLIGSDVKLNSPSSLIGQALSEILQHPERARDSLRVLLHLVEKSLQRIQNGQRNSMYTSQQSVENKVGGVPGWQALLTAVGFRLDPTATGLPAAVFFPIADPGDRLQQCSTTLQSLLGHILSHSKKNAPTYSSPTSMAAVIGNPKLPSSIMDRWLWGPMPSAEEEAYMVSELLGCQPLVGPAATKERVMSALSQAECVHFATHMSWKLAALVLTPNSDGSSGGGGGKGSYGNSYTIPESLRMQDDASDVESITDSPPLQEFLLTAADILDLRLPVKLVVLGSYQESNSKVTADGVIGLTRAFLAAGAQCVLVFLWPVPVAASKMFVHAFYFDPGDRLQQCSTTLQSLLGLPHPAFQALCKLISASETGEQLINRLHQVLVQLQAGDKEHDFTSTPIQVSISVQLWRLPGCHEFLAALGFDLCEVGQEEVVLKTGKQANRRTMHFALQSLLALFDSTELPKRLSLDSSSSLESLASAQSVSNPMPLGYPNPPFSPTCPDSMASDAISVYSLSSIASSMSFVSKAESTSEYMSHRGRQDYERGKMFYSQKTSVPRSRSSPHANISANKDDEEYEGFSIISNEPLAGNSDSLPLPASHKLLKGNERMSEMAKACYGASVSSRGSVSTPTSPIKMTLIPSQNSPFQKVGKLPSSDTGESDQSSTETDSTVKSQEEKTTKLDPQELAQKILEETQSHLIAVECLQRSGSQTSCVSEPIGGASTPTGGSAFRSSEMSAFSRPHSASLKSQSSPITVRPKPPSRTSSLQKVSSGYNSPATSETSLKDGSGQPSPTTDPHSLAQFKLKYPTSPYSTHISRSPSNISPSSGHQSPSVSNPSPDLSYSSTGSARSSPADAPDLDRLKLAALDEKVQAIHNLKTFWTNTSQHPSGPVRALRGNIGASKRDVLSLLNLSPRHSKREKGTNNLELKELAIQQVELTSPQKNPPNGHKRPETNKVVAPSPSASASSSPGGRPLRLPSGNGYKFLSPGRFFPSSKC
ncbi:UNVERIFIED_CONTAM: hypothetical protein FKN15_039114 [Acipenser sinensis]